MNTLINYVYTDECNYKVYNEAVIKGEISLGEVSEIMDCLDSGEFFIPSQVGLPEEKFPEVTDADHPWFTLQSFELTEKPYDDGLDVKDVKDLVERFKKARGNWDEFSWLRY